MAMRLKYDRSFLAALLSTMKKREKDLVINREQVFQLFRFFILGVQEGLSVVSSLFFSPPDPCLMVPHV